MIAEKTAAEIKIEREQLIKKLVDMLPVLRTKLGLSQKEIAEMLDISRQTYSAVETKRRRLTWGHFLSLVLLFDSNVETHRLIRSNDIFPRSIICGSGEEAWERVFSSFVINDGDDIRNHLDEQAIHAIETVIMLEYARCKKMPGEEVVKAFDGKRFKEPSEQPANVGKLLRRIKTKKADGKK